MFTLREDFPPDFLEFWLHSHMVEDFLLVLLSSRLGWTHDVFGTQLVLNSPIRLEQGRF